MEAGDATSPPEEDHYQFVDGTYRTKPRSISLLARMLPSCVFFLRFASIVLKASALAKRSKYDDEAWGQSSLASVRALESVGVQFEFTGVDHLRHVEGACVVVGNHMSTMETVVLPSIIQPIRKVTFVVKASLLDYPVFKHVMRSRDPIAVSQSNAREDLKTVLVEGEQRLRRGVSIMVFPEGSRRLAFDPAHFNTIGVKLAHRAEAPIIPLALSAAAWPVGRLLPDMARIDPTKKVRFAFGAPLWVSGRGTAENQAIINFIEGKLSQWRAEDAGESPGG